MLSHVRILQGPPLHHAPAATAAHPQPRVRGCGRGRVRWWGHGGGPGVCAGLVRTLFDEPTTRREGSTRQKGQVMTHKWILSTALGRPRCPRLRFVRNQVLCSNLRIVGVARGGGGGRRDGPSWSRARQRDLPKARGSRTGGWALARPKRSPSRAWLSPRPHRPKQQRKNRPADP